MQNNVDMLKWKPLVRVHPGAVLVLQVPVKYLLDVKTETMQFASYEVQRPHTIFPRRKHYFALDVDISAKDQY